MDLSTLILALQNFLNQGGAVLWAILSVSFIASLIFIERFIFLKFVAKELQNQWIIRYKADPNSYHRMFLKSIARRNLFQHAQILKFFIALLPLFGLLGTVTGMIEVFDVMGHFGNSNPRLMASGVAKAIIPTMTGMAIAVIGLISYHFFINLAKKRSRQLEKQFNEVIL